MEQHLALLDVGLPFVDPALVCVNVSEIESDLRCEDFEGVVEAGDALELHDFNPEPEVVLASCQLTGF